METRDLKKTLSAISNLQNDYIKLLDAEDAECEDALAYYNQLVDELKKNVKEESLKYARLLVTHPHFTNALEIENGSLYTPVLSLIQTIFRGHKHLIAILMKEHSCSLSQVLNTLVSHFRLAIDCIAIQDGSLLAPQQSDVDDLEMPYHPEEALQIVDMTMKLIKSITDHGGKEHVVYIIKSCPDLSECLTKCSALVNSREIAKLSIMFSEIHHEIKEKDDKKNAAIKIQSFWRGVLTRRKTKIMLKGFRKFQILYREKLQSKEAKMLQMLNQSEREFEEKFEALCNRRVEKEQVYASIKNTPSRNLLSRFFSAEEEKAAAKIQEFWRRRGGKSSSIASSTNKQNSILFHSKSKKINPHKVESAALLIQYTVRRWLAKRWMMDGPILGEGTKASSLSLRLQPTQKIISEERVRNLQHEIETWQHRNKVPPMTPNEIMELQQKAQFKYARYYHTSAVRRRKIRDQKIQSTIAQTKAIAELLESAPKLNEYDETNPHHRNAFHSIPLHIATKARLEHNKAMKAMEQPSWMKLLNEYGS